VIPEASNGNVLETSDNRRTLISPGIGALENEKDGSRRLETVEHCEISPSTPRKELVESALGRDANICETSEPRLEWTEDKRLEEIVVSAHESRL
jgi:hypothetical protein